METGRSIVVYEKRMVRKESKAEKVSEVRGHCCNEMTIYNLNAIQSTLNHQDERGVKTNGTYQVEGYCWRCQYVRKSYVE